MNLSYFLLVCQTCYPAGALATYGCLFCLCLVQMVVVLIFLTHSHSFSGCSNQLVTNVYIAELTLSVCQQPSVKMKIQPSYECQITCCIDNKFAFSINRSLNIEIFYSTSRPNSPNDLSSICCSNSLQILSNYYACRCAVYPVSN